jgi:chromosome segregation ATPase
MPKDELDHIPAIVPSREGAPAGGRSKARAARGGGNRPAPQKPRARAGGSGWLARLFMTVALVVAAVACAWAWQLQGELQQANTVMADYAQRIGDLEDRLSDTDEGMSQNAEVQAAKIRELDLEVRKLWDNVWKQTKERLTQLEQDNTAQGNKINTATADLGKAQGQINSATGDIAKLQAVTRELDTLKGVTKELDTLMAGSKRSQAEVERVADSLNQINLDIAKLNKRVQGNEEWINSINNFRKQVNASLVELKAGAGAKQATP